MWAMIFSGLILGTVVGLFYLAGRFSRFSIIKKISGGKKLVAFLIGIIPVALIIFCVRAGLGTINAEIAILHMMVIWLLCDGISKLAEKVRKAKFTRYYAGICALGITAVYLCCGWYLANHVWRRPYTVETDKEVGSLRIVQFADSHVGNTFDGEEFLEHVKSMQAENPDIVVITGD